MPVEFNLRARGIPETQAALDATYKALGDFRPLWPKVQALAGQDLDQTTSASGLAPLSKDWAKRKGHDRIFELSGKFLKAAHKPKLSRTKRRFRASLGSESYPYILHYGSKRTKLPARPWFFWLEPTEAKVHKEAAAFVDRVLTKFARGGR